MFGTFENLSNQFINQWGDLSCSGITFVASCWMYLDIVLFISSVSPCSVTGYPCFNWHSRGQMWQGLLCFLFVWQSVFFGRMYSFMGGGLFCAGVGNILLIVSTATDYWMQYRHSSNYMHQGLWRYCVPGKCMTHTDSIGKTCYVSSTGRPSYIFISVLTTSPRPHH